jgi:hypothetical protein
MFIFVQSIAIVNQSCFVSNFGFSETNVVHIIIPLLFVLSAYHRLAYQRQRINLSDIGGGSSSQLKNILSSDKVLVVSRIQ